MSLQYYPPLVESKLPAFAVESNTNQVVLNVPYTLNKAVSASNFSRMAIKLKTVTTGTVKLLTDTGDSKLSNMTQTNHWATFTFNKDATGGDADLTTFTPLPGNYYKVQIAFKEGSTQSPWSSVGVIKCTSKPTININSLTIGADNVNPSIYHATYENADVSEKLYTYNFTIYDNDNNIYETSGDLIHNGSTDENISNVGVRSTIQWKPLKSLPEGKRYCIAMSITTINGYTCSTSAYFIRSAATVDANIPARLLAETDFDNGCVKLSLVKNKELAMEQLFTGQFVVSRYTKKTNTWNEMCRFNMLSQAPSDIGLLWTDYTIEHGEQYLYSLQAYNDKGLYSNRLYHVIPHPHGAESYLEFDEYGKPYYIMADFEDIFLTDENRQLRVRYNPTVSSYKPTILENKVETIGSKYPFIFRNGNVNYKEFPISGLLSYLVDEQEYFMKGIQPPETQMSRSHSPAATGSQSREDWLIAAQSGTKLTSDNFYRERQFKMEALEWLTNGKPKLFRSPGEGTHIVQLMNTSLSPEETLGRMLHTFNTTAYEIADCTFDNLNKYGLLSLPNYDNRVMKFRSDNLYSLSSDGVFSPGYTMYHVSITNATPGTIYNFTFPSENAPVQLAVGITGALFLEPETLTPSSISLVSGDYNHTAIIHYGYYDTSVPDNFSYISNIITKDEAIQIIGYDAAKNVITDKLEDIRREVGIFHSITISPRNITTIYSNSGKFYRDLGYITEITGNWSDLEIYFDYTTKKYYSGNPNGNIVLSTNTAPSQQFLLNDIYLLDLATGNSWQTYDPLYDMPKNKALDKEYFIATTNGRYIVSGDFGEIRSIKLTPGIYADLAYELKEIEYTVEETHDEVKEAKQNWLDAAEAFQNNASLSNKDVMDDAYADYLEILEEAIETSMSEEGYYVL